MSGEVKRLIQHAIAALEAAECDRADTCLCQAAEEAPGCADFFHMLGLIPCHRNAPEEAVALLRRALHLNPKHREAEVNLAITLAEMGDFADAEASLQRALDLSPERAEAYVNLGLRHHRRGHLNEAMRTWERALHIDPMHQLACCHLTQATTAGTARE